MIAVLSNSVNVEPNTYISLPSDFIQELPDLLWLYLNIAFYIVAVLPFSTLRFAFRGAVLFMN